METMNIRDEIAFISALPNAMRFDDLSLCFGLITTAQEYQNWLTTEAPLKAVQGL